ncbi:hypothetical protein Fcan01_20251 [Folsomia candida]|uniref:Uncharacterized protein n=1 Tax=Folsomia candida TaxID=158441 RepID=A0A226DJX5_FOLCA|nr:hypothetical protein Fcan01_20251 [Folsomia candida]
MTTVRGDGVVNEISDEVQIVNTTAERNVLSNSLLVHLILDNLAVKDLKTCASTSFTFYSEAVKLLDMKSKIYLWSERFQSYFETLKKGGRIPKRSIVEMTIGTPQDFISSIPSTPTRFPNIPLEIMRRIDGDKVRYLQIHVETTKNFFAKMRQLLSLAVNLDELELYFKNVYHCDTNFVAALPFDDTFQLPNLKKLGFVWMRWTLMDKQGSGYFYAGSFNLFLSLIEI